MPEGKESIECGGSALSMHQDGPQVKYLEELKDQASGFGRRITAWGEKEQLSFAAGQLERYNIPYVWKYRDGEWAIFRRVGEEPERATLEETKLAKRMWEELAREDLIPSARKIETDSQGPKRGERRGNRLE